MVTASSYIIARVPDGAMGYAFQLYFSPCNYSYAEFDGSILDLLSRFRVIAACVVRWSHSCSGQWLSVDASPLMNWFLNVWMALSAAFTL